MEAVEWVSLSDAARRLSADGDKVSSQALGQYLNGHQEVSRRLEGPGRPVLVDFDALKMSRLTRRGRGPSSKPDQPALEMTHTPMAAGADVPGPAGASVDSFSSRKARADTERAEHDARRAAVLADEAEGRSIRRDVAMSAFRAAGIGLAQVLEQRRRGLIDALASALPPREADMAMREYERSVRAGFALALADFAATANPASTATP